MEAGAIVGIVLGVIAIILLLVIILLLIVRRMFVGTAGLYTEDIRTDGKTVIITGATAGIGKVTAFDLAARGARVILACRNVPKAKIVADEIISATGNNNIITHYLDTSKLTSVRDFSKTILETEDKIDILILNAGISGYNDYRLTEDKIEITMATNHFGHFLLTNLLLGLIVKSAPSRIISVASQLSMLIRNLNAEDIDIKESSFGMVNPYSLSKTCNILFCGYLGPILQKHNVTVNSMCPGKTETEIQSKGDACFSSVILGYLPSFLGRTVEQGVATLLYLAVDDKVKDITGQFFVDYKVSSRLTPVSRNKDLMKKVWQKSEDVVKLTEDERGLLKELMSPS